MNGTRLDHLVQRMTTLGSRRDLVRALAALPMTGWAAALPGMAAAAEHKRDAVTTERRKHKKTCKPKPKARICAGKCGVVKNNCKKKVNCGPCCTVCPSGCAYTTLQAAVDAVQTGDTVRICAGTFAGEAGRVVIAKNLTLVGAGTGKTILDGESADNQRVVDVAPGAVVTIRDLTIMRGNHPSDVGGGVRNQGTLTLDGCLIGENKAGSGGGVFNEIHATLTLTDCTIDGNAAMAGSGGGLYNSNDATLTARGCTMVDNTARNGAGLYSYDASLSMTDTTVSGNTATNQGGGVRVTAGGTALLSRCRIENNAAEDGGGLMNHLAVVTIGDSQITGNTATTGGGAYVGGGGTVTLDNSDVTQNTASFGGGIFNESGTVALVNGATVTANEPNNCAGTTPVPGCSG